MKIIKSHHLTAFEKKMIRTSLENNLQDIATKNKRLNIICSDQNGNVKANLHSFEVGIGIGAKKRWITRQIEFSN